MIFKKKYIKQYEDSEELTDDVFIQLFNHLENLNLDKDIKYYLMASAKNASINFMKKTIVLWNWIIMLLMFLAQTIYIFLYL